MSEYRFTKVEVGRFKVYESRPALGDEHKKRFVVPGVTPSTQATFNLYAAGEFSFEIPETEFSQVLRAGGTSLDLTLQDFPLNAICLERVTSAEAVRYCIGPTVSAPWQKSVVELATDETLQLAAGACVFVLSGRVQANGETHASSVFLSPSGVLTALESTRLAVAQ